MIKYKNKLIVMKIIIVSVKLKSERIINYSASYSSSVKDSSRSFLDESEYLE